MTWQEAAVLVTVSVGATVANIASGFDPLAVYTGIVAWGARSVLA